MRATLTSWDNLIPSAVFDGGVILLLCIAGASIVAYVWRKQ